MNNKKVSRAFTLVELLIVIAIIGVLASLIYPALSRAMGAGSQVKSMNNAKNIAQAWITSDNMIAARDIYEWAGILSKKAELDDPRIWLLDFDPRVQEKVAMGASMPVSVTEEYGDFKTFPVSWEVANRALKNAPSGTPLLWTRGLKMDGTWDIDIGVFQDQGGHIAFNDAHVQWYTSLLDDNQKGVLKRYGSAKRTHNIAEAIRGGATNILRSALDID